MSTNNHLRESEMSDKQGLSSLAEKYRHMIATALEISEIHERTGQWDQAVNLLQFMLEVVNKTEDKKSEAKLRVLLGDLLWKRGAFDEARAILQEADLLAKEISDYKIQGDCFYHLGELYYVEAVVMRKRDHTAALEYHDKARALREKSGDREGFVQSLSRLGTIHEHMGELDQALEYHNKAIEIAQEINYDRGLYRPITHIGAFYRRQGDLKTALTHYQRALEVCRRINDKQGLVFALGNVGRTLFDLDEKTFDDSLQLCREALKIAERLDFKLAINRTLMIIGNVYVNRDQDKAKEFFQRVRDNAVKTGYEAHRLLAEKRIAELEK